MRIFRFTAFFVLVSFLIIGCGNNSNSNSTIQEGSGNGTIIVHVSDGNPASRPLYTWEDLTNDTTAEKISVARTTALNTPVWGVQSVNFTDNIQSPWPQGSTTASVSTISTTEVDLKSQIEYRVTITKADGITSGYRNFTIMQ
jgi:hypothetical protein